MTNCTKIKILKSPQARHPMLDLVAEMRPRALGPVPDYLLHIQGEKMIRISLWSVNYQKLHIWQQAIF